MCISPGDARIYYRDLRREEDKIEVGE